MFDWCNPISFQATTKKKYPDLPTCFETLIGPDCEAFYKAMGQEIQELDTKNTWTLVKHSEMKAQNYKALPSTLAFHRKQFPNGSICNLKAHLCVHGDLETYGVDCFESYAPVIQWTTVR